MNSLVFVFGRTPDLAFLELVNFVPQVSRISPEAALIQVDNLPKNFNLVDFHHKLGGTVKIAKTLYTICNFDIEILAAAILPLATTKQRFNFAISVYGDKQLPLSVLQNIKKYLTLHGINANFAYNQHGQPLSSVTVDKRKLFEFILIRQPPGWLLSLTVNVQDYHEWKRRDYDRPHSAPHTGMLPPKVSRMIVNIARPKSNLPDKFPLLLDPFCGMGTILAEAMLCGWQVYGCDHKQDVVDKARQNLEWLKRNYSSQYLEYNLHKSEATHVSEWIKHGSIDAIVTEPYLGSSTLGGRRKEKITHLKLKNMIRGLEKLYLGALRDWKLVLKPSGRVVIALPMYEINGRKYFVKKVIDSCENLGYTVLHGPLEYSRPQAVVKREFYVLNYGSR